MLTAFEKFDSRDSAAAKMAAVNAMAESGPAARLVGAFMMRPFGEVISRSCKTRPAGHGAQPDGLLTAPPLILTRR